MTNFFDWLLKAPISEILDLIENEELEVFGSEAHKDGEFIRFEVAFTKPDEHEWFMVHPDHPRWDELKTIPLQKVIRIPFQCLNSRIKEMFAS